MSEIVLSNDNFYLGSGGGVNLRPIGSYTKFNEWYKIYEDEAYEVYGYDGKKTWDEQPPQRSLLWYTEPLTEAKERVSFCWIENAFVIYYSETSPDGTYYALPYTDINQTDKTITGYMRCIVEPVLDSTKLTTYIYFTNRFVNNSSVTQTALYYTIKAKVNK